MRSMIDQLSFVDSKDMDKYQTYYLRSQVVAHFITFKDLLKDLLKENIKSLYGAGEEGGDGGPFSIRGYLKYMVKDKVRWDSIFIGLVASMWGCGISVLRADSGNVVNYRHELPLAMCDIGLLFNCEVDSGHYCGLWRMDGNFVKTEQVKKSIGFKDDVDEKEIESLFGSGGKGVKDDEVMVQKARLDELMKKEVMFD